MVIASLPVSLRDSITPINYAARLLIGRLFILCKPTNRSGAGIAPSIVAPVVAVITVSIVRPRLPQDQNRLGEAAEFALRNYVGRKAA
jgi:hypothetical protein